MCELYLTEIVYRNRNKITYYNTTNFNKTNSYQDTESTMLVKIEYKDIVKYIISSHEIKQEEIEQIAMAPKLFLSVECSYGDVKIEEIELTKEANMLVPNTELEFNNKTVQILLFIKNNSNKKPINSNILWGIITSNAEFYKTNYIKFKIKDNKLFEYKD